MKRRNLLKRIAQEARRQGADWQVDREGANHTVYRLGELMIPVPRHSEIGERLAESILKQCEPELGKRWWR